MKTELLKYAFTGVNIIPTVLLLVMQLYWLVAITGFFDFDILDLDLDLEGGEEGILGALAVFINIGKVPVALVFSMFILNFWIIAMMMYFLPISPGGFINGLLLFLAFYAAMLVTKYEVLPLKFIFKGKKDDRDVKNIVLKQYCVLKTDLEAGHLGQAVVKQKGASIVINVLPYLENESFKKGDTAFVFSKNGNDVYYVARLLSDEMMNKED